MTFYLRNQKNKTNLINFVFKIWATDFQHHLKDHQIIYMANSDGTVDKLIHNTLEQLQWTTDYEEAASKMFVFS